MKWWVWAILIIAILVLTAIVTEIYIGYPPLDEGASQGISAFKTNISE